MTNLPIGKILIQKFIQSILLFIYILLLVVPLWIVPTHSSQAKDLQSLALSQPTFSDEYTTKLRSARKIEEVIKKLVECIEEHNTQLISNTNVLQKDLENNLSQKNYLSSELESLKAEYEGFKNQHDSALGELGERRCEMSPLTVIFPWSLAPCIAQKLKVPQDVQKTLDHLNPNQNVENLSNAVDSSEQKMREKDEQIEKAEADSDKIEEKIKQNEDELKHQMNAISILNNEIQLDRLLLDDFEEALKEANSLYVNGITSARTAREIARMSDKVGGLVGRYRDAIKHASSVLQKTAAKSCVKTYAGTLPVGAIHELPLQVDTIYSAIA